MNSQTYHWKISQSSGLIYFLTLVYIFALSACFLNALALIIKLSLAVFIFLHGLQTWQRFAHENWQLDFDETNGWQIFEASTMKVIEILPSTVISKLVIFFHYQCEGKRCYRLIFKDALLPSVNDYRQLLVTLKTAS